MKILNFLTINIIAVLLISTFLTNPEESYGEYYTGECPNLTMTETQAKERLVELNAIEEFLLDAQDVPLFYELQMKFTDIRNLIADTEKCVNYFDNTKGSQYLYSPVASGFPGSVNVCPNIAWSEEYAKGVQDDLHHYFATYSEFAGTNAQDDRYLDLAQENLDMVNECLTFFGERQIQAEFLDSLIPDDIKDLVNVGDTPQEAYQKGLTLDKKILQSCQKLGFSHDQLGEDNYFATTKLILLKESIDFTNPYNPETEKVNAEQYVKGFLDGCKDRYNFGYNQPKTTVEFIQKMVAELKDVEAEEFEEEIPSGIDPQLVQKAKNHGDWDGTGSDACQQEGINDARKMDPRKSWEEVRAISAQKQIGDEFYKPGMYGIPKDKEGRFTSDLEQIYKTEFMRACHDIYENKFDEEFAKIKTSSARTDNIMDEMAPGGCLIATATYGTELAPQVQLLREIRQNTLYSTESGSAFMSGFNQIYYLFSPTISDWERENLAFKETIKIIITPMISSLTILNHVNMDSESEVLVYGISMIILNLGMYIGIPASVIVGIKRKLH